MSPPVLFLLLFRFLRFMYCFLRCACVRICSTFSARARGLFFMSLLMEDGSMGKTVRSSESTALNYRASRSLERVISVQNSLSVASDAIAIGGYEDARAHLEAAKHDLRMALAELPRR